MRHHEELSRGFVPRSDLVLFVTSAERPLTESERGYLEHIRDWGKKILLVFNKADLLADESKVEEVPNRRRKAREQFREKTDSLRMRLGEVVRRQFEVESNRSVERMREAIAPYTRFVRSEHARMTSAGEDLAALDAESRALRDEISAPGVGPKTSL
jgi:tRNA U34 5-carboxymethylaminomethyl modifying GTPase MnmE/TrmE